MNYGTNRIKTVIGQIKKEKGDDIRILDLGCGSNKFAGAVGIDIYPLPGVDIVWELNSYPLPFKDSEFDVILCSHIIEHLADVVKIMEEIHRTGKPKAKIIIRTPYFAYYESFCDPTHRWHFTWESFDFFCRDKSTVYAKAKFLMQHKKLLFGKEFFNIGRIISEISMRRYEKYYSHRYPAQELYFELEVIK